MMIFKAQKSFSLLAFLYFLLFLLLLLTFRSANFLHSHFHFHHDKSTEEPHTCMSEKRLCGYFIHVAWTFSAWWCWMNLALIKFLLLFSSFSMLFKFPHDWMQWRNYEANVMHLSMYPGWKISMMSSILYVFVNSAYPHLFVWIALVSH